jgi:hypothetical protein
MAGPSVLRPDFERDPHYCTIVWFGHLADVATASFDVHFRGRGAQGGGDSPTRSISLVVLMPESQLGWKN